MFDPKNMIGWMYEQVKEAMDAKYHPTDRIKEERETEDDAVARHLYESMADYSSGERSGHMIVDRDQNYCNGLYREK
jgi:hypothetical protein